MITTDTDGIETDIQNSNASGDLTITHNGKITAKVKGLNLMHSGTGDITVTTGEKSMITTGEGGSESVDASLKGAGRTGAIRVTHGGTIASEESHGIYGSIRGAAADSEAESITRDATSTGTINIETAKGSKVTGGEDGIHLWRNGGGTAAGQGAFNVTIRGMVMGDEVAADSTEYAGVRIAAKGTKGNGGTIVVGPYAHVASGSGGPSRWTAMQGMWWFCWRRTRMAW